MPERLGRSLRALASAWGIQLAYTDGNGVRRRATRDSVLGVLRALGISAGSDREVEEALAERAVIRAVEPVVVSWDGDEPSIPVGVPGTLELTIELEDGSTHAWRAPPGPAGRRVAIPVDLPPGYHAVHAGDVDSLLIRAPRAAVSWPERSWGIFMPAYAIRTATDWGIGDLRGLADLLVQTGRRGGRVVATLPLLAAFLDEPFEPAPYSPVSKLFWNELMIDVEALAPELDARHREQIAALRALPTVDHRAVNELKRSVLLPLAMRAAGEAEMRSAGDVSPQLEDYAAFRARTAAAGPWTGWGENLPAPDPDELLYHRFVQTVLARQLDRLDREASAANATLLFDMPAGVHPLGYDAWRYRESFAAGAYAGAPPDSFFTKGQDWGFHPMHPERIRASGYAYPRACLRAMLEHAKVLRIDHIVGLHRMWWIPPGHDAADGAFVRSHPEEMYAILALESQRTGSVIVGEDLGTVPREVRRSMGAHGIARTYVVQEEIDPGRGLRPVPSASVAMVNTHDMPTFAAFWTGSDIDMRRAKGLLTEEEVARERTVRARKIEALQPVVGAGSDPLISILSHLGRSRARIVIANLEDLWGERGSVNIPGTSDGNWRRRGKEPVSEASPVWGTLDELDASRKP